MSNGLYKYVTYRFQLSNPGQGSRRSSYRRKIAKAAVIGAGAYAGYKVITDQTHLNIYIIIK